MTDRSNPDSAPAGPAGRLGTFGGVFTPSILTILGIILFMRLGWVVGSAGLGRALAIIALANVISVLTAFSLSAVATNMRVKGGGDYYLISRTLGVAFGGAIGVVLYLAQSVSIAFYTIGFGEALAAMIPSAPPHAAQGIAAAAAAFLFIFAWLGADWATRFQYVVMAVLAAAIVSFFAGGSLRWDPALIEANWAAPEGGPGFFVLFAIFFPAVTGFTQGVSMSGDLKDPGKSLPRGTFAAVGLSMLVYFGAALLFAGGMGQGGLRRDYGAMKEIAAVRWLVDAGVVAATLSSAMASFLGAPRILQSLAKDRVFPFLGVFAKGAGPAGNPRRGLLLSAAIAFATIALGNLNVIAPLVSMFFLISYGLLNYATFFEIRAKSPSFRPRFRWYDRRLSLLGALGCLAAMLAVNLAAGLVAAAILLAIHQYLSRTAGPARWADSRRSYLFQLLREHLFAIAAEPEHPRNWRPQLLVFSNHSRRREQLLRFSSWIEGESGLTTAVRILEGEGARVRREREQAQEELRAHIAGLGIAAFERVVAAPSVLTGARILIQSYGIGPVRANTVVLNWIEQVLGGGTGEEKKGEERYGRYLRAALRLGCNVVVLDSREEEWRAMRAFPAEERRIDVWWTNDASSRLCLLLAYLMTRSAEWSRARIRLLSLRGGKEEGAQTKEDLEGVLEEARIEAEAVVFDAVDRDLVAERSAGAGLVFLPLRIRSYQPVDPFGESLEDLFDRLPVVAVVLAAGDIPLDAEPEEGEAGETARVLDEAEEAARKAAKAEKGAARAEEEAEKKRRILEETVVSGKGGEEETRAGKEAEKALEEAEKASRRAAKARVKAEAKAEDAAETAGGAAVPMDGKPGEGERKEEGDGRDRE